MFKTTTVGIACHGHGGKLIMHKVQMDTLGSLGVHPTRDQEGRWAVTHLNTGFAVYQYFDSKEQACAVVKELAFQPGWDADRATIQQNIVLKRIVRSVLKRHGIKIRRGQLRLGK